MRKLALAALGGIAALSMAPAANAAETLVITGASGIFGNDTVGAGSFTNTFNFTTPEGFNLSSASITSVQTGTSNMTNIDFTSVTLNGVNFNTLSTGVQEFRNILNQAIVPGAVNTLIVSGTSGADAAFSGNLSFAAVSAVPEPATWAMMLIGFGAVGHSMRKRPSGQLSYKLAQAV